MQNQKTCNLLFLLCYLEIVEREQELEQKKSQ